MLPHAWSHHPLPQFSADTYLLLITSHSRRKCGKVVHKPQFSLSPVLFLCVCARWSVPKGERAQGTGLKALLHFLAHHVIWSNYFPSLGLDASSVDRDKPFTWCCCPNGHLKTLRAVSSTWSDSNCHSSHPPAAPRSRLYQAHFIVASVIPRLCSSPSSWYTAPHPRSWLFGSPSHAGLVIHLCP